MLEPHAYALMFKGAHSPPRRGTIQQQPIDDGKKLTNSLHLLLRGVLVLRGVLRGVHLGMWQSDLRGLFRSQVAGARAPYGAQECPAATRGRRQAARHPGSQTERQLASQAASHLGRLARHPPGEPPGSQAARQPAPEHLST